MQVRAQFFHLFLSPPVRRPFAARPTGDSRTMTPLSAPSPTLSARWARARPWVGAAAALLALGLGVALAFERAPAALIWLYLLLLCLLPACVPGTFGRWAALGILLLAGIAPGLAVRAGLLPADGPTPLYVALLLALLGVWAMLPATLVLLLVRRRASMALTLLAGAALPPALLLMLAATGLPPGSEPAATPGGLLQQSAALTPFAAVTLACCLAPAFFAASLLRLVAKEARGVE